MSPQPSEQTAGPRLRLLLPILFGLLALLASGPVAARGIFDVFDYGAVGDGKTVDTKAIQAAIDACTAAGGGQVYLAGGRFVSGTIRLKSNVALYVEAGAALLGSPSLSDYPEITPSYPSYAVHYSLRSLIYAEKQENISILGSGVIDGQGHFHFHPDKSWPRNFKVRPWVIRVIECTNVTVRNIRLQNSSMWMQHYQACDNVLIDGITVRSNKCKQSNCLTLDGCHNARVSNCDFASCDDCFELKSLSPRSCKNILVTNCSFTGNCNGFKLGTESMGGFQNITISNCTFENVRLAAVALELVDGGVLDRVNVSNLVMHNVGAAVFIRLGNKARHLSGLKKPGVGVLRNVMINNIQATGVGRCVPTPDMVFYTPKDPCNDPLPPDGYRLENHYGLSITGLPGHPVENVSLSNIRLQFLGGGTLEDTAREIPEKPDAYPECNMFGTPLPAYGFYVRHARGVRFENLQLAFERPDDRPAIVCDDVEDLTINAMKAQVSERAAALIRLTQVRSAFIHSCRLPSPVASFVLLEGDQSRDVMIVNNDLSRAGRVLVTDEQVPADVVFRANNRVGPGEHASDVSD